MTYKSLTGIIDALLAKKISALEIANYYLNRVESMNGVLNAYIELYSDSARALAKKYDTTKNASSHFGPLQCMPLCVKDVFDVKGRVTTIGMRSTDIVPDHTATIVKCLQSSGANLLGKNTLVEFAFGGWGINRKQGTPRNPWDMKTHRSPGGSSSGTAVAVASDLAACGLGTDTGGSVRIPAAFCGLTGLKTTKGCFSNEGVRPLSKSLDTVGIIAKTALDAKVVYQAAVQSGDKGIVKRNLDGRVEEKLGRLNTRISIGILDLEKMGPIDTEVLTAVKNACWVLEQLGADLYDIKLDQIGNEQEKTGLIMAYESFIEYGDMIGGDLEAGDIGARQRVLTGKQISTSQYREILSERKKETGRFLEVFKKVDLLALPTLSITAKPINEIDEADSTPTKLTRFVNYYGLCAIAIPVGQDTKGLPISLQLVAAPFNELFLLSLAELFQKNSNHHLKVPPPLK